ncbi:MAG: CinA family protein [Bacteroidaceae bacterium]|nr:CinA family protein [Bacteroidaceae bacterium]
MDKIIARRALSVVTTLIEQNRSIATAESCSGGGIAAALTSVSGSSAVVKGGVVAYATEAKRNVLHVSPTTLDEKGVVSEATVLEMARGAIRVFDAEIGIATSGVTGPSGGTPENPVCTVWIAVVNKKGRFATFRFGDLDRGRSKNTRNAILNALRLLSDFLKSEKNE